MGTELQVAQRNPQMGTEVALGPPAHRKQWLVASVIGIPIGVGVLLSPVLVGVACGVALVGYVVASIAVSMSRARRFSVENSDAVGALGRGELAKAHEVFARWAASSHVFVSAVARHNLGWTMMLEGRVTHAVAILEDVAEHYHRALLRLGMLPTTRVDVALCYALLGNLDDAEMWFVRASEPVNGPTLPSFPGTRALVRAVIDCRKGRAAEASALLDQAWREQEAAMTGEALRVMRVVRAFACATGGPRNQGMVERVLGELKPRYEGEFAWLSGAWSEMAAFLATHRLV